MIRKDLPLTGEQRIRAYKDTKMFKFFLGPKDKPAVRGAVIDGTLLIQQMRKNHDLGILESLILGHGYLGALLMTSQLKGHDTISISITCDGPAQGLLVEANAFGEVRGYLKTDHIPVNKPIESNDYSEFFGTGVLDITRILEGGKRPFSSRLNLEYGNIAQDLANYYTVSEQTPSAFHLSIRFDEAGEIIGAGGIKLQAMPTLDDLETQDTVRRIENQMMVLPSLGSELAHGQQAMEYIHHWFQDFGIQELDSRPVEFMCHCSKDRFLKHLNNLPETDKKELKEKGPFPLILTCHHCNSSYEIPENILHNL